MDYIREQFAIDGAPQIVNGLYATEDISAHLKESKQGFLICCDVPITRAATDLMYAASEITDPNIVAENGVVKVRRELKDIMAPETIASFEMMPITLEHPDEFVTPDTVKEVIVGNVRNVRQGEGKHSDKVVSDLYIFDPDAIEAIKSGQLREVSIGYDVVYIAEGAGRARQENIIGNHLALVRAGRCGSECAVIDSAPNKLTGKMSMIKGLKSKVAKVFNKARDEALMEIEAPAEDEMTEQEKMDDIVGRLAKLEGNKKAFREEDEMPERNKLDDIIGRLAKLEGGKEAFKNESPKQRKELEEDETPLEAARMSWEDRITGIEEKVARLLRLEEAEGNELEVEREEDASQCMDHEVVARAEILAPGIYLDPKMSKKDICKTAVHAAYQTMDGRTVIDSILAGAAFDSVSPEILFNAASDVRGAQRSQFINQYPARDGLSAPKVPLDQMSPALMNLQAKEFYKQNS